ncbi:hypothetical protein K1719_000584 [Acacia pycnantha]|nr:hypothetical protein K1719_000584 [Acacia pycnantha]
MGVSRPMCPVSSANFQSDLAARTSPIDTKDRLPLEPGNIGLSVDLSPHHALALNGKFWASFFAETKCESVERLRGVSKLGFDGLACVLSVGRSGGLLAAWKSSLIEVEVLTLDRQFVHLKCRFPNDRWFGVTTVYTIPDRDHKQLLWSSLFSIASAMAYPWTVIGDFNDIACATERSEDPKSSTGRQKS